MPDSALAVDGVWVGAASTTQSDGGGFDLGPIALALGGVGVAAAGGTAAGAAKKAAGASWAQQLPHSERRGEGDTAGDTARETIVKDTAAGSPGPRAAVSPLSLSHASAHSHLT
jgi:hypothetical protein